MKRLVRGECRSFYALCDIASIIRTCPLVWQLLLQILLLLFWQLSITHLLPSWFGTGVSTQTLCFTCDCCILIVWVIDELTEVCVMTTQWAPDCPTSHILSRILVPETKRRVTPLLHRSQLFVLNLWCFFVCVWNFCRQIRADFV